jgi:Sulfotransferase domain
MTVTELPTELPTEPAYPAFVGIGALKAGSTFLDGVLRSHPELCLPPAVKEVDYFSRHYHRGPQWYRSQFDGCTARRHGEVSPRYLVEPASPARIAAANPSARLLLVARDPVRRAYSQYKHRVRTTGYRGAFDAYLTANPGTLDRGRYFHHARRYLELFDPKQLHVVVFEDLVRDPLPTVQAVYRFLGVDDAYVPAGYDQAANVSWQPSRRRTYVLAKQLSRRLHDRGLGHAAAVVSRSPVAGWLTGRQVRLTVDLPTEATERRLRDEYRADVEALSGLVGRDLAELWWARRPERVT